MVLQSEDASRLPAEAHARLLIDQQLHVAGWAVQDRKGMNLFAGEPGVHGIAVREVIMAPGHGRVDYLLYVNKKVVGVIEAKPQGTTLSGVEWQSAMYATGLPAEHRKRAHIVGERLPFVFEASGSETHFTNGYDPAPRARKVFNFPKPSTLARIVREATDDPALPTWRSKVRHMPPLSTESLRPAQVDAIENTEKSLAAQRADRSLIQMATGAGKTYTAVTLSYRLLKHAGFKRVLFLVDRNNLAKQTAAEFSNYVTPDDGRKFSELYAVDRLKSGRMFSSSDVVISTIQRVYSVLRGKEIPEGDDPSLDDFVPDAPVEIAYNPDMPPESFDLVIVDEAHRSIYGAWKGVLEYFDAHVLGLTATPGKQTFAFFRQNLVSQYTYTESVADAVNVDFDIYRIKTEVSQNGSTIEAGTFVPKVDRRTRVQRIEAIDEELEYKKSQLDRAVQNPNQIRTVLQAFRDRLFTEIFPGRTAVPKTLIFCKDDAHAEEVVTQVRQVFGKGNDFAAKITYQAKDPEGHLQAFRTSASLRIAVTVDMIATGTDVKPLECVFFMRDVRSAQYFEQMKGRGARTIAKADFQAVTPDAQTCAAAQEKTRFVIVDAVGVTEHAFVDPPLMRTKSVSLEKLLGKAASLTITEDETATLASRLAALELQVTPAERAELAKVAGQPLRAIVKDLVEACDPQVHAEALAAVGNEAERDQVVEELIEKAIEPLAANPELRTRILELRRQHDLIIDDTNPDSLIEAYGVGEEDKAREIVDDWRAYLEEHRSEISAIQVLQQAADASDRPTGSTFEQIKELADRIARPPHRWTPQRLWAAHEQVEKGRVRRNARAQTTDLVSLLRFTLAGDDELVPYADKVRERYQGWLLQQEQAGVVFTDTQRWWLDNMANVIASSAGIDVDQLDGAPFDERGGIDGALRDLGNQAGEILETLNKELTA
ncbi:DEAD/DEAH box helicase family protein [Streptomyces sp. Ag109_O5-10]|uniref:type I restriction endonuclease subunit R n=1 Tax=Streptomyces sp. Ag109_O5-10 TaxID=1855349 RepID=UPI00089B8C0E|nr:DEAD/DEAH box helicase family protein [Streptomyces sp. Ag109_O5-10]SEE57271.1 type I restriction enzyme, R subunit [Streptomyces sp. Ag109_O5-10]